MTDSIRILIADDHPIVRAGLRSILEDDPRVEIVGEVGTGNQVLEQYEALTPDILVLDLAIPMKDDGETPATAGGLETLRLLMRRDSKAKVVVVTMVDRSPIPERALDLGAKGYVVKNSAVSDLVAAVDAVYNGETYLSSQVSQLIKVGEAAAPSKLLAKLTRRELEVFMHLASGEAPAAIGEKMGLSHKTVHAHRASILRKLNLKSNTDLVRFGISSGIIYP